MELEELRAAWRADAGRDRDAVVRLWDGMASRFVRRDVTLENNAFLRLMAEKSELSEKTAVLDLGCGAGSYILALAPRIGRGVGCDISAEMLSAARAGAGEKGLDNVEFLRLDWQTADIDELGWRERFDVVFAHMTPAVADYDTLDKMVLCARKHCYLTKPCRRTDRLLDAGMDVLGLRRRDAGGDAMMENTFAYLWKKGFEPAFTYEHHDNETETSVEEAVSSALRWAALQRKTGPEDEEKLREYYTSAAGNGKVKGRTVSTVVTIDWAV